MAKEKKNSKEYLPIRRGEFIELGGMVFANNLGWASVVLYLLSILFFFENDTLQTFVLFGTAPIAFIVTLYLIYKYWDHLS